MGIKEPNTKLRRVRRSILKYEGRSFRLFIFVPSFVCLISICLFLRFFLYSFVPLFGCLLSSLHLFVSSFIRVFVCFFVRLFIVVPSSVCLISICLFLRVFASSVRLFIFVPSFVCLFARSFVSLFTQRMSSAVDAAGVQLTSILFTIGTNEYPQEGKAKHSRLVASR